MQKPIHPEDMSTVRPEIRLYYTITGRTIAYTVESKLSFSVEMSYENKAGVEALAVLPLEEGYFCAFVLWCDAQVYIKCGPITFVMGSAEKRKEAVLCAMN